jgi:hypothetical protein
MFPFQPEHWWRSDEGEENRDKEQCNNLLCLTDAIDDDHDRRRDDEEARSAKRTIWHTQNFLDHIFFSFRSEIIATAGYPRTSLLLSTCGFIPCSDISIPILLFLRLFPVGLVIATLVFLVSISIAITVASAITITIAIVMLLLFHPVIVLGMVPVDEVLCIAAVADCLLIVTTFE